MNRENYLFFEIDEATFNTNKFILFMDKFTVQIVKRTVVIPDNYPIHMSKKFIAKIRVWNEKELLIFFLPLYSRVLKLKFFDIESSINGYLLILISVLSI